jgi:hypothetical protein
MSGRGAPVGNHNAAKGKQWMAAIERALERMGDPSINPDVPIARSPRMKALDALADAFVRKLDAEQDLGFFREFGDRLDGKPKQQIEASGIDGGPITLSVTSDDAGVL